MLLFVFALVPICKSSWWVTNGADPYSHFPTNLPPPLFVAFVVCVSTSNHLILWSQQTRLIILTDARGLRFVT